MRRNFESTVTPDHHTQPRASWISRFALVALSAVAGCREPLPGKAPVQPTPVAVDAGPAVVDTPNLLSLGGLLGLEATTRPQGTPSAERIFEAMRAAGVGLVEARQNLGRPHGARYCANARSVEGLYVMVCEYGSPEELKKGEPITRAVFEKAKGSSWQAVGNTGVLMLRETEAGAAQAQRASAALQKL